MYRKPGQLEFGFGDAQLQKSPDGLRSGQQIVVGPVGGPGCMDADEICHDGYNRPGCRRFVAIVAYRADCQRMNHYHQVRLESFNRLMNMRAGKLIKEF